MFVIFSKNSKKASLRFLEQLRYQLLLAGFPVGIFFG